MSSDALKVVYTSESQTDIEVIYAYVATEGGAHAADRLLDALVATCDDLGRFPGMGRRRPELDDLGLEVRSIVERGYVVFYTEYESRVHVVRVVHTARDLSLETLDALRTITKD